MTGKYLSLSETVSTFLRSVPGFALMYVVVGVVLAVATQDKEVLLYTAFFAVALTPVLWLRWEGTTRSPMANPKALPLVLGWFGLCAAAAFLLDRSGLFS